MSSEVFGYVAIAAVDVAIVCKIKLEAPAPAIVGCPVLLTTHVP
jgi:hypothetical protein